MDVGPNFGLPPFFVRSGLAAGGASRVECSGSDVCADWNSSWQFDEDAPNFLDLFVLPKDVFVAQEIPEAEFLGLVLGLCASVKRSVLRPQLFGGVTCHPEGFFVRHYGFAPGSRSRLVAA